MSSEAVESKSCLAGVKIVDLSWVVMTPLATSYLAAYGATVVKIESLKRPDIGRLFWPHAKVSIGINDSAFFSNYNCNKYSIALNLKNLRALDVARRLIDWADILVESQSPGSMERLGLGYEEVKKINPDIIMVRASIQGQTGYWSSQPGFGYNVTSLSGFSHLVGWPDRMPVGQNYAYPDFIAPWYIIIAIMAALKHRRSTGRGQLIDLSQLEAAQSFLSPAILDYSVNHRVCNATGNRCPDAAPHGVYRCQGDDRWCVIAVSSDEEWRSFCQVIGNPEWSMEPRFATLLKRKQNEDELDRRVEEWTLSYSPEQVMQMMQARGVSAGVVQTNEDLVEKDQGLKAWDYFWHLKHPEMGEIIVDGLSFKLSETPGLRREPPPCLGEHTEFVCRKILKMSDEEFIELMQDGDVFV